MSKPTYEYKNLTKEEQSCLSLIESLGIYELRALARVFGDASPTTIKRNDHITIVMDKIISGEELKPIPMRQGRPYKELSNIEGILAQLSQITGRDYTLKTIQQSTVSAKPKAVSFKQVEKEILQKKLCPIECQGIIKENDDKNLYFINQNNGKQILVPKNLDERLQKGDFVSGTAVIMNAEKQYTLDQIKKINYEPAANYKVTNGEYVLDVPTVKLADTDIILGGRYVINQEKFTNNAQKIENLLKKLKKDGIITLACIPNVMYEDFIELQSLGFNNTFLIKYDNKPFEMYEIVNTFIEHITHLQELGKNIAIFVQDFSTLANGIDFAFKNNTKALMGHTEMAVETIKNLVRLAKAGQMHKHTTLFTTFDNSDMFDQTYVSCVYKVSKKIELK